MMTHPTNSRRQALLPSVILLTLVALAYSPIFRAGYIWDDPDYVVNNLTLRNLPGLWHIWTDPLSIPQYYPLVHTTFWLEYHLWTLHPLGYHIDNLLLHTLGCFLFYRLLQKLDVPGALIAATLFAVHPVQVESVAWITERKNVLCGVFYFSAFLAWIRFDTSRSRHDYIALCALFVAALLSKTISASLPAAILVVIWWKRGRIARRDVIPLLPLFLVGAIAGIATAYIEHYYVGASGKEWAFNPIDRILIAGRAIWFYLYKVLVPANFSFIYPRWKIDWHDAVQYLFPLAVLVCGSICFLVRKSSRAPLAVFLLFIGTLFPALGFSNVYPMRYSFVADHFQYLACAVIFVAIGTSIGRLPRAAVAPVAICIVLVLSVLTFARASVYKDALALWTDTLRRNPDSFMVHFNYSEALLDIAKNPATTPQRKAELEAEAHRHRLKSLELAPNLPETHWNVGVDYTLQNKPDDAMREFREALRLDPGHAQSCNSIGLLYLEKGDLDKAYEYFDHATQLQPGFVIAQFNAGTVLEKKGDLNGAIQRYIQALSGKPDYAEAHYNLATCLMTQGRLGQAASEFLETIKYKPDKAEAHTNLGVIYMTVGRYRQAADEFEAALRINPNLVPAQKSLEAARRHLAP